MTLNVQLKDEQFILSLRQVAAQRDVSVDHLIENMLKKQFSDQMSERKDAYLRFSALQNNLRQKQQGKLMSDSAHIIRESRQHDY